MYFSVNMATNIFKLVPITACKYAKYDYDWHLTLRVPDKQWNIFSQERKVQYCNIKAAFDCKRIDQRQDKLCVILS